MSKRYLLPKKFRDESGFPHFFTGKDEAIGFFLGVETGERRKRVKISEDLYKELYKEATRNSKEYPPP